MSMSVEEMEKKTKPWAAEGLMLPASMVLVQAFTMGALLLSKMALNVGMEPFVLLAYRNLIGAITVAPFAFYFEREMRKKVNHRVWGWISINAQLGGEKLVMATWPGKMKVLGTVICVGGTTVISLYKGRLLHLWPSHLLKPQLQAVGATSSSQSHHHNMLAGTLFLCGSCLAYAVWFIVQVGVSKVFPCKYFSTMLACVSGTVQAVVIGMAINRDASAWALNWDLQLLTVVYSGVFNTGITFCLISWAIARRGPIYPSMFNSLSLIVTMVLDSLLLGTDVSVGSLLGALLIIVGLYAFLLGKDKEMQQQKQTRARAADDHGSKEECATNGEEIIRAQAGENDREVQIQLEVR